MDDDLVGAVPTVDVHQLDGHADVRVEVGRRLEGRVEDQPGAGRFIAVAFGVRQPALLGDDAEGVAGVDVLGAVGKAGVVSIGRVALVARDDAAGAQGEGDHVPALGSYDDGHVVAALEGGELLLAGADLDPRVARRSGVLGSATSQQPHGKRGRCDVPPQHRFADWTAQNLAAA